MSNARDVIGDTLLHGGRCNILLLFTSEFLVHKFRNRCSSIRVYLQRPVRNDEHLQGLTVIQATPSSGIEGNWKDD